MQRLAVIQWFRQGPERTTFLLILVYAAAFIKSPSSLPHVHADEHHHDSASCYTDPCHVSIYHQGNGKGCDHRYHLTAGSEECKNCDIVTLRQLPAALTILPVATFEKPQAVAFLILPQSLDSFIFHTDRGPPAFS